MVEGKVISFIGAERAKERAANVELAGITVDVAVGEAAADEEGANKEVDGGATFIAWAEARSLTLTAEEQKDEYKKWCGPARWVSCATL